MRSTDELPPDGPARRAELPEVPSPQVLLADDLDDQADRLSSTRRLILSVIVAFFLVAPFFSRPRPTLAQAAFLVPATVILILLFSRVVMAPGPPRRDRAATISLIIIIALGVAILIVGGLNWVGAIFIAGAAAGRLGQSPRTAGAGTACCSAAGLGVGLYHGVNYGSSLELTLGPALAAFFAYAAARRGELVAKLRETRAELARMAVADERLRIARDLHDLLGHSLSLITLKAELAGRLVGTDPDRAAKEITDLESVARRSLGEVRAAVTSYRQPTLAAELAEARQMLAAAGMDAVIHAPASVDLAPEAEALLAWTVREGATNVVRHSGARTVTITITADAREVTAEVADDGVGPPWGLGPGAGPPGSDLPGSSPPGSDLPGSGLPGSGLTGLTERARQVGAQISAGEGHAGKGFRLLVRVPAGRFSGL
jgi:two-component system, NarL family, sensor histidine kinase DesK